jgi:hypothetical protein
MLGQPPKDSARNIFIGGIGSQKVIDTMISIPQSTNWYSDVIDLEQYGALGVIAKAIKISSPTYGYLYLQFSDDLNFSYNYLTYPAIAAPGSAIIYPKVGRYVRIQFSSYSTTGIYQFKITLELTPLPLSPAIQMIYPGLVSISIESDRAAIAKSSDIPVPYRFAQTYSVAAGSNTGRISIDLQNYRDCAIYILANQASSITIEGSTDNTNWEAYDNESGTANTPWYKAYTLFPHRYLGITVANSGTATSTVKVRVIASKF